MAANSVDRSSIGGHNVQVGYIGGDLIVGSAWPYGDTTPSDLSVAMPEGLVEHEIRGRSDLLAELAGQVRTVGGRFVLHGAGGYGKTTSAYALARKMRGERDVWWVDATTREGFLEGLREVAVQAGASRTEARDVWRTGESAKDLLWRTLHRPDTRPWLLIVDNADEPESVADWIRRPMAGNTVLVTSRDARRQSWWKDAELRAVGPLSERNSAEVLTELAPDAGSTEDARRLARRLGGLPLALRLVGNYLAESSTGPALPGSRTPRSFADFGSALDAAFAQTLSSLHQSQELTDRQILSHTWELSLDLLESRGIATARPLLRLFSFFTPSPLPSLVLKPELIRASGLFPDFEVTDLEAALKGLVRFGLLRRERIEAPPEAIDTFVQHPLVGEVIRSHPDVVEQQEVYRTLRVAFLYSAAGDLDPDDLETWPVWRLLLTHCRFTDLELDVLGKGDLKLHGSVTYLAGDFARISGLWPAAEDQYRSSLDFRVRENGELHPDVIIIRRVLASLKRDRGRLQIAEEDFRAILDTSYQVLGSEHPTTLAIRQELARALLEQQKFEEAEVELSTVVPEMTRMLGPDHNDTLAARNELARVLRFRGKLGDAVAEFREITNAMTAALGPESILTLNARHELAVALKERGDTAAARTELNEVLAVESRVQGAEHPNTLLTRAGLANLLVQQGNLDAALDELRKILGAWARLGESEHRFAIDAREILASALTAKGDFGAAEEEYRHILAARMEAFGPRYSDTLVTRSNIAHLCKLRGEYSAAEDELRDILAERIRSYGVSDSSTLSVQEQLADLLMVRGRISEAQDELNNIYAIKAEYLGTGHAEVLRKRVQITGIMLMQGRTTDALRELQELVPQMCRICGTDDEDTITSWINLGGALFVHEQHEAAVTELRAAFHAAKRSLGMNHPLTVNARGILNEIARGETRKRR